MRVCGAGWGSDRREVGLLGDEDLGWGSIERVLVTVDTVEDRFGAAVVDEFMIISKDDKTGEGRLFWSGFRGGLEGVSEGKI